MELAAWPRDGRENGGMRAGEACVSVTDNQFEAEEAPGREARKVRQWTSASLRATLPPRGLEFERGGTLADLGGTHGMPAEPILVTFRVETPWIYISAIASLRAFSLRMPFSRELG